jgi:cell division protein FtsB
VRLPVPAISRARLVLLAVLVPAALLFYGFVQQSIVEQRIEQRAEAIRAEIRRLQEERTELTGRITYYQTDDYIERAAREKLNMVRPGDVPVVIVREQTPAPAPEPTPTPAPSGPAGYWPRWLDWLRGRAPLSGG